MGVKKELDLTDDFQRTGDLGITMLRARPVETVVYFMVICDVLGQEIELTFSLERKSFSEDQLNNLVESGKIDRGQHKVLERKAPELAEFLQRRTP